MNPGSTNQTTTQTSPAFQTPYQNYGLNQAMSYYQGGGTPIAGFSPMQNEALGGVQNLATNNPVTNAASNYTTNVLNNGPESNPYLNSMFNQAAQQTQNQLASQYAGAGSNVGNSQAARADQLNNLATNIYGGAYNTGIQQQEAAAAGAPGVQGMQYNDLNALYGGGANVQGLAQQYAAQPYTSLQQYMGMVGPNMGQQTTTPYYYNQGAGALGGALTGVGLANNLGINPILGAIGGGILGG